MRYLSIGISILITCLHVASTLRILGVFPHMGKSHMYVFHPLMMALAERGHQVTVVTRFPVDEPSAGYNEIILEGASSTWKALSLEEDKFKSIYARWTTLMTMGREACETMFADQRVLAIAPGQFDLVIVEQFNTDCGLALVHRLQVPWVGVTSHEPMPFMANRVGSLSNPSFVANHFIGHGTRPGVFATIESLAVNTLMIADYRYNHQENQRTMLLGHYPELPDLETIARNVSLMLVHGYHSFTGPRLLPPNVVEIAGIHLHYAVNKSSMTEDIKQFLDKSTEGVVLFSMGSMLRGTSWKPEKLQAFQHAFSKLPMKILWKWEDDIMENATGNVKIVKWLPQFDVLRHRNIKAFIAHGGLLGLTEAVYAGVPVMVIPVFGDQFKNAADVVESGMGVKISIENVTGESIEWGLRHILSPSVQRHAKDLSARWRDRPTSPMDTAIFWIEHVAKFGGDHMRPPTVNISLIRYFLLDVIAVLLAIVSVFVLVVYALVKCVMEMGKRKTKKD